MKRLNTFAIKRFVAIAITCFLSMGSLRAQPDDPETSFNQVEKYLLEDILVEGTQRIAREDLIARSGIRIGEFLEESEVKRIRSNLLATGLFTSVSVFQKRGSKRGFVILTIRLEDDYSVVSAWAIGAKYGVILGELQESHTGFSSPPLAQQIELVSRNLFSSQYRGRAFVDFDSAGLMRGSAFALGTPRISSESWSTDIEVKLEDPALRFLNCMAYAQRSRALVSIPMATRGALSFGLADFKNSGTRFNNPLFAKHFYGLTGQAALETRLHKFLPTTGYKLGLAAYTGFKNTKNYSYTSSEKTSSTLAELSLAATIKPFSFLWVTIEGESLHQDRFEEVIRGEARFEIPANFDAPEITDASWYLKLRAGSDRVKSETLHAGAVMLGLRFYSTALIGELAIQITKSPSFIDNRLQGTTAHGP